MADNDFTAAELFKVDMLQQDFREYCVNKKIIVLMAVIIMESPSEPHKVIQTGINISPPSVSKTMFERLSKIRRWLVRKMLQWNIDWVGERS